MLLCLWDRLYNKASRPQECVLQSALTNNFFRRKAMATKIILKQCSKCKQDFPATTEYFHTHKGRKDGLYSSCKRCKRQYHRRYDKEHKVERLQYREVHRAEKQQYLKQYRNTTRGHLNVIWYCILQRCNNPKHLSYEYYGGRGIKVKFVRFEDFYNYVVNELSVDPRGLTIDRIDNNGHYEHGNIRFVTMSENCRNRRPRKKRVQE